jgi:predicted AAA+ superfamily ATPase
VPPFFENLGKRLVKSPKVYIADSGLACHLLGIDSQAELRKSPFLGDLFEGMVAAEIVKQQLHGGRRRQLYYFRDQQGLEVDFVVPGRSGQMRLIEVKATASVRPGMAAPMRRLAAAMAGSPSVRGTVQMFVLHLPSRGATESQAIAPGVRAMPWPQFLARESD